MTTTPVNRERWVPRCHHCHNGHIIVAPSPINPHDALDVCDRPWYVYCVECGYTTPITELLYVRL